MATTTDVARRIDLGLWEITTEATFLSELATGWDQEHEATQVSWSLEWDELMARLEGLDQAYRAGLMTAEQQHRFRTLRQTLRTQLPILERLGFSPPTVPLED